MAALLKWKIAFELYDQALKNGIRFDWMTFDEGYGSKPDFLRGLSSRKQKFVGEVPRSFTGWLDPPRVVTRPYHKNGRGRGRKVPRLSSGIRPARRVEELLDEPAFRAQAWQRWRVKDGEKGPMIREEKHPRFTPEAEDGMPGEPMHLVVARNVLDTKEVKFFMSNAPPETPFQKMLLVGFSRWRVERCFEDQKSEIGLDQNEGRRYWGLKRHLILRVYPETPIVLRGPLIWVAGAKRSAPRGPRPLPPGHAALGPGHPNSHLQSFLDRL